MILRHVTVDCADPYELGRFWSSVTGWPLADDDDPGDPEALLQSPSPGVPGLLSLHPGARGEDGQDPAAHRLGADGAHAGRRGRPGPGAGRDPVRGPPPARR